MMLAYNKGRLIRNTFMRLIFGLPLNQDVFLIGDSSRLMVT